MRTEIIIRATRTQNVLGEKGRRIRELTSLVQKRFDFPEGNVELYAERVLNRAMCAIAQAESLRYKLLEGLAVRRACYGVLRYIMENGTMGCEIIVSGKLRAQRAKAMKFKDGYMLKSGDAINHYIDSAVRHIKLKQGVLGIKVAIMLPHDPTGKAGCAVMQPDVVTVIEPKPKDPFVCPRSKGCAENFNVPEPQQQAPPQQQQQVCTLTRESLCATHFLVLVTRARAMELCEGAQE
jgi:small subunit ribosomal protein S3e